MGYTEQAAAVLTHAQAAAAAIDADWLDVSIGAPVPRGNRSVRLLWDGEAHPVRMGALESLNSEMVGQRIQLVAFWTIADLGEVEIAAVLEEVRLFVHGFRTRILGDCDLGGNAADLSIEPALVEWLLINGIRYVTASTVITPEYVEYSRTP